MAGFPFPPARPREGAAVCPAQCQRSEKFGVKTFLFILISLTLSDEMNVCAGMEKQGKKRISREQRVSFICPGNRSANRLRSLIQITNLLLVNVDKNKDPLELCNFYIPCVHCVPTY